MTDLQAACIRRIEECYAIARTRWPNNTFPNPRVIFTKRGRVAGTAHLSLNEINLNNGLLVENGDAFIADTPGHEAAHLIAYIVFGDRGHGRGWKTVMRVIGQAANRCHNFDTTNTRIVRKNGRNIKARCVTCSATFTIGERHKALLLNPTTASFVQHKCRTYRGARGKIVLCTETPEVVPAVPMTIAAGPKTAPRDHTPKTAPRGPTKMSIALEIFNACKDAEMSRSDTIARMVEGAGLTKAGASTYYQKFKS